MTHEEYIQRINAALDERRPLDAEAELVELAWQDAERRELLAGYRLLAQACPPREEIARIPGLADRVLAQLQAENAPQVAAATIAAATAAPRQGRNWLAVASIVALAAALLVAVLPAVFRVQQPNDIAVNNVPAPTHKQPAPNKQLADPNTQIVVAPPQPTIEPGEKHLNELVREAGSRYLELASDTGESFAEVAILLPQFEKRAAGMPPQETKRWVDQVGDGLKPVTRSVGGALDFLLEALPTGESG